MVDFQWVQNSKLSEKVAFLRSQLGVKSVGEKATSGVDSSPWSAIDVVLGLSEVLEHQRWPLIIDLDGMEVKHPESSNEKMRLALRMNQGS